MNNNEMIIQDQQVVSEGRDYLKDAGRVFDYLEEHPGVGFMAGGTFAAGGIGALIYYGSKLLNVS